MTSNPDRDTRLKHEIQKHAASFINMESNRKTMITVTDVALSSDGKNVTIFITAFPEDQEPAALDFLKRKRPEFKSFVKEHASLKRIPFFDFEIDYGEKKRRQIDSLLNENPVKSSSESAIDIEDSEQGTVAK